MRYAPVTTMNNTAWQNARRKAGLADVHVHDLRHTVGMRLREAGVREETIADVLWHRRRGITAHYSAAQMRELRQALDLISDESGRANASLRMLSQAARAARAQGAQRHVGASPSQEVPSVSLQQRKMA